MAYSKFYPNGWQSGAAGGTPITPEALQHMEDGIVEAAPGGYGLGNISYLSGNQTRFTDPSKLDEMKVNSFWAYQKSGAPLIADQADTQFLYGYTVASGKPYVTQRAITLYGGSWIERTLGLRNSNSEWSAWKYVNPPMAEGKTYLTTEFFLSKPVYKQVISMGTFPAGEGWHGIEDEGFVSNNPSGGADANGETGSTRSIVSVELVSLSGAPIELTALGSGYIELKTPASFPGGTIYQVISYTLS